MNNEFINEYLVNEATFKYLLIFWILLSITLSGLFLLVIRYSFFKGIGISFLIISVLEISVAFTSFKYVQTESINLSHGNQVLILKQLIDNIEKNSVHFSVHLWVSVVLCTTGALLYSKIKKKSKAFWNGLGAGIAIKCFLLILFILINEVYLSNFKKELSVYMEHNGKL